MPSSRKQTGFDMGRSNETGLLPGSQSEPVSGFRRLKTVHGMYYNSKCCFLRNVSRCLVALVRFLLVNRNFLVSVYHNTALSQGLSPRAIKVLLISIPVTPAILAILCFRDTGSENLRKFPLR